MKMTAAEHAKLTATRPDYARHFPLNHICAVCGLPFHARNSLAIFCSDACSREAKVAKRKAESTGIHDRLANLEARVSGLENKLEGEAQR